MNIPKKILIIDDDRDIVELLAYNLKKQGFNVVATTSPTEAIWKLENEEKPHLIVLDRMMPFLNGDELCQYLKEKGPLCQVPIIIISAKGSKENIQEGMDLGAAVYLVKPFGMEEFLRHVRELV